MHDPSIDLVELKKLCVRIQNILAPTSRTDKDALYQAASEVIACGERLIDWTREK